MSRDLPPVGGEDHEPPEPQPPGRVRVTGPGPLVVAGLVGLFLGWVLRGAAIRLDKPTPGVSWLGVGVTFFLAAAVAQIAVLTWRTVRRQRHELTAQQGMARLVLGKTMSRLGAFGTGAYVGVVISHLGIPSETAGGVILRGSLAALGAGLTVSAGLLLEHACRVPPEDPRDLP